METMIVQIIEQAIEQDRRQRPMFGLGWAIDQYAKWTLRYGLYEIKAVADLERAMPPAYHELVDGMNDYARHHVLDIIFWQLYMGRYHRYL